MKILAVCLGNICRSPLAEGILRKKSEKHGLDWHIDSAGTAAWHEGKSPDSRSVEVALRYNIDIRDQKARKFITEDFSKFDLILAMDSSNMKDIKSLALNPEDETKVELLLNYLYPGMNQAVPDPYYDGRFEEVFEMINLACDQIIKKYKKKIDE